MCSVHVPKNWANTSISEIKTPYFTLAPAETPNLALRVRNAKKGVPGVRKAATIQQIPGTN